jgi:hypothetical protein
LEVIAMPDRASVRPIGGRIPDPGATTDPDTDLTAAHRFVADGTPRRGRRLPNRRERWTAYWAERRRKAGGMRGPMSLLFGTPRNRDMKRRWPLSLFLILLYGWLGYTTVADDNAPFIFPMVENRTFFPGILHGFTLPFNYVWQLFSDDPVTIYQAPNNNEWYNTGWLLGLLLLVVFVRFLLRMKFNIVRSKKIRLHTPHRPDPRPTD